MNNTTGGQQSATWNLFAFLSKISMLLKGKSHAWKKDKASIFERHILSNWYHISKPCKPVFLT